MNLQIVSLPHNLPLLITLLILSSLYVETSSSQNLLRRGSHLSVEDSSHVLVSPDKTFSCGFYNLDGENAYWFSIWYTNSRDTTVVWMANRDRPVNGKGSRLSLNEKGAMVLTDVDGTTIWMTNTTLTGADSAQLLDSGNLVLKDMKGNILWQSFDFPSDTLLPGQYITKGVKLISSLGKGNFGSGYFSFYFDNDNVLRLMYDGPDTSSVYWPNPGWDVFQNGRTKYNNSRLGVLDNEGSFVSSDIFQFNAIDKGFGIKRRLTMDYDGNLRLYSLDDNSGLWIVSWEALSQPCNVHGICGRNGICVYGREPKCTCPPGYEAAEPGNWKKGCKPKFNKTCSSSQQFKFIKMSHVDFYGYDLAFLQAVSMDTCMKLCLNDCLCDAFSYRLTGQGFCFTKSVLFNGVRTTSFPGDIYVKLPVDVEASEPANLVGTNIVCPTRVPETVIGSSSMYDSTVKRINWFYLYGFGIAIGAIEAILFVLGWWFLFRRHDMPPSLEEGYRAISSQFRRFSYIELKKATNNFTKEVGRGASGAVYKGVLGDERAVAVKRLEDFYQGEEVFWAEVSTIGNIYHMNLVRMWGFCSEKKHRLLVYEYVKNRSLDKHLFSSDFLGWKERYKVALGTAKGLAYLHHECLEWVIHCDVKPENILLGSDFEPKIADFGLAKLSQRGSKSSEFSRIRGTKGYMAPEWALNLPITAKVDVYSYGVVVLEMVKGKRLSNWVVVDDGNEEETELKRFVRIVKGKVECSDESWIDGDVDPRLNGKFIRNQVATLVRIGISCVEEDRSKRPTMDSVVQTLLECEAESEVENSGKL